MLCTNNHTMYHFFVLSERSKLNEKKSTQTHDRKGSKKRENHFDIEYIDGKYLQNNTRMRLKEALNHTIVHSKIV